MKYLTNSIILLVTIIIVTGCTGQKNIRFVLMPDIQTYTRLYPEILECQTRWIKEHADSITFVLQQGDMTENNISYSKEKINIYLFYGEGCPHCEELKNYLNSLDNKEKSYFNIYTFEVWNNSTNQQFMKDSAKYLNKEVSGVPFLIIGNKTFEGYNESMNIKIKKAIKTEYKLNGKNDYYKEYKSAK